MRWFGRSLETLVAGAFILRTGSRLVNVFAVLGEARRAVQLRLTINPEPFQVVSPYAGVSNTRGLSLVNAVPTVHSLLPLTLASGGSQVNFDVCAVNYVSGSAVYWNTFDDAGGRRISCWYRRRATDCDRSSSTACDCGYCDDNCGQSRPRGGTSNSLTMDVSSAHPVVVYLSRVDCGTVLLNFPASQRRFNCKTSGPRTTPLVRSR